MPAAEATGIPETVVPAATVILLAALLAAIIPFLCVRYRYRFEGGLLVIRRAVLGVIPCGEHRVRLSDIAAVQRCGWGGGGRHCLNYGTMLSGNGVRLILRRRYMVYGSIRVTPGDAEEFMRQVGARVGGRRRTEESRSRRVEESERPGGNGQIEESRSRGVEEAERPGGNGRRRR